MIDEIFDRTYQSGRNELNDGLDRVFRRTGRAVTGAFDALHRIQFAAPWAKHARDGKCA